MLHRSVLAVLAVLPVLCSVRTAAAWEPYAASKPVWPVTPVHYRVNQATLPTGITVADVDAAFAAWGSIECTSYEAVNDGDSNVTTQSVSDGENTLLWVTDYSAYGPPFEMAKTTVRFDVDGHILETDTIFNADDYCWNHTGTGGCIDAQSIITHEIGHALGLGHTSDSAAVMYPSYPGGTAWRSLTADDADGVCALYPVSTSTSSSSATSSSSVSTGAASTSSSGSVGAGVGGGSSASGTTSGSGGSASTTDGGCSVVRGGASPGGAAIALAILALQRRRRRGSASGARR